METVSNALSNLKKKRRSLQELIQLYRQGRMKSRLDIYAQVFRFHVAPADTVLDAGCGVGTRSAEVLVDSDAYVYAFDISSSNLREVKRIARTLSPSRLDAIQGDLLHLPFRDGVFTKTFCLEVLEHVLDDRRAFRELCRVLHSKGALLLSVPTHFSEQFYNRIGLRHPYHLRTYTLEEIISIVAADLHIVNLEKAYFQCFILFAIAASSHASINFQKGQVAKKTMAVMTCDRVWSLFEKLKLARPLDFVLARFTPFARSVVITAVKEKNYGEFPN